MKNMKLKKLKRKHFWKRNEFPKPWQSVLGRFEDGSGQPETVQGQWQVGNFSKVKDKVKNHSYKDTLLETFCSFPMGQLKGSGLHRTSTSFWISNILVPALSPLILIPDVCLPIWDPGRKLEHSATKRAGTSASMVQTSSCGALERIQSKRRFIRFGFGIDRGLCQNTTRNGLCFSCWCSTAIWTLHRTRYISYWSIILIG